MPRDFYTEALNIIGLPGPTQDQTNDTPQGPQTLERSHLSALYGYIVALQNQLLANSITPISEASISGQPTG
jgi:hypothetical protein